MSAPFIIPFDNNPASTSIKTASYTIPAGKYAKVKGWFINTGTGTASTYTLRTLTINGVSVYIEDSILITRMAFTTTTGTAAFTVPQQFNGVMTLNWYNNSTATQTLTYDSVAGFGWFRITTPIATATAFGPYDTYVTGGTTIHGVSVSGSLNQYMRLSLKRDASEGYFEAWVPSGTVLSGSTASSFNWLVEEYNVIS